MTDTAQVNQAGYEIIKFGALAGFIAASTILINLNYKAFNSVFQKKTKMVWFLFFVMAALPFGIMLLLFSYFFEGR